MYYQWENFAVSPVDADEENAVHDVAIVGGGPVGLSLAASLQRQGLDVILLEARTQVSDGSRAITMNRDSLSFFSRLGLAEEFLAMAQTRQRSIVFHGREELWRTEFGPETNERWPSLALLQQCWIEHLLIGKLGADASSVLRWGHAVTGIEQNTGSVTLQIDAGGQRYRTAARYVVGADGARGITRKSLGLQYRDVIPKRGADTNFVICDFTMDYQLESGRRLFIGPEYAPDSVSIFHSQPFDVWRLDYEVPQGLTAEEAATPEAAEARVREHLAMMGIDADPQLLWVTTYRAMGRTLDSYRHGRVIFVGDAAHQSPIFGGRGLNMGFGDVNALAWRLPLALSGDESQLDDYSRERTHVVRNTLEALTPVCLFMTSADEQSRVLRSEVMNLLPEAPRLKELVDGHAATQVSAFPLPRSRPNAVARPLRDLVVVTESQQECFLSELLPVGGFAVTLLPHRPAGPGSVFLQLRDAAGDEAMVVTAPRHVVSQRLGLESAGDTLIGRPDEMVSVVPVTPEVGAEADADADHPPLTELQESFVRLSLRMAEEDGGTVGSAEVRALLMDSLLEGAGR
ncbi:FAD-dependent oxidoreductase [Arthrobacter citreus]|uniref:FAD-dependent oxidoreductase n=1 Tax=Arthrobacter citreus TaxID=1670 RepID=UPI0036DF1329